MNQLSRVKLFTKLDLKNTYHQIYIKKGNEWKTVFCTYYSHFKYMIMPFELTNALVMFQAYINQILVDLIDVFCIVYLDNILIYFKMLEKH